jgi:hypothetical protein
MMATTTVITAIVLLSLGVTCLVLAAVAGRYSVEHGGRRTISLATLGVAALVGMLLVLASDSWSSVWAEMILPLAVYGLAVLAGAGLGLSLLYSLVSAR